MPTLPVKVFAQEYLAPDIRFGIFYVEYVADPKTGPATFAGVPRPTGAPSRG